MTMLVLATVLVRLLAIWLAATSIGAVPALVGSWVEHKALRRQVELTLLASGGLPFVTAALIWGWAEWLAARIVGSRGDLLLPDAWTTATAQRFGVTLVGLFVLVGAVPDLVWYISVWVQLGWSRETALGPIEASEDLRVQFWNVSGKANVAAVLARVGIGAWLLGNPTSLVRRMSGEESASEPEEA